MEVNPVVVRISDSSGVGEARRQALEVARAVGFGEEAAGRVGIVATELAGNLFKHARGGSCYVAASPVSNDPYVQIVSVDRGGGLAEPARAFEDGRSTTSTPGTGLGAVRRLSSEFDLYNEPSVGVVAVARLRSQRPARDPAPDCPAITDVAAVEAPLEGEDRSGDGWAVEREGPVTTLIVCDGLGHGGGAAEAADLAIAAFTSAGGLGPADRLQRIHDRMRASRGAAVAVIRIDAAAGSVRFSGLGNISAQIVGGTRSQSLVSMNGIVGHIAPRIREFSYGLVENSLVIIHSDGVSARWSVDDYLGTARRDPAILAALLLRDHGRARDDAIVVVARHRSRAPSAATL